MFSFNAVHVPDDNVQNKKLRVVPKRNLDEVNSIEMDVDNAILAAAAAAANSNGGQLTTTAALEVNNKIDAEENSIVTPSSHPTEADVDTSTAATKATEAATTTTITTATTIPIRDMIHKRSQQVKQLLLDQFSGSNNSPPNPRYHQSLHTKKMVAPNTSCAQDDAFIGIPIDDGKHHPWVPPGGYPQEALTKWEKAFNAAMRRIREEASGGDMLREFAEAEVKQLRKLRHSLFCKRE